MTRRATLELKNATGLRKASLIWLPTALDSSKPQSLAVADESRGGLLAATQFTSAKPVLHRMQKQVLL